MTERPEIRNPRLRRPRPQDFRAPGVFITEQPAVMRTIAEVPTSTTAFVGRFAAGPVATPTLVRSAAEMASLFPGGGATAAAVELFFANGGSTAWVVRVADAAGPGPLVDGMVALDGFDDVALLCVPDTADMTSTEAAMVAAAAATYATTRTMFYVMDLPGNGDPAAAITWLADHPTLRSPNAAAYLPGVIGIGGSVSVAPSGAVAGVYARTDAARGVWKAPAGSSGSLVGIESLEHAYETTDIEDLVAAGLNPLRTTGSGPIVWGSRTTAGADGGDPEWKYVPVRRLALFLERSIGRGTQWAVFEPNGETLWTQLRAAVDQFLTGLWRLGAFQGSKADDAYFVRCDRSTMTQADIDAGRIIVTVGFAPLKPAEFIVLRFVQQTHAR